MMGENARSTRERPCVRRRRRVLCPGCGGRSERHCLLSFSDLRTYVVSKVMELLSEIMAATPEPQAMAAAGRPAGAVGSQVPFCREEGHVSSPKPAA